MPQYSPMGQYNLTSTQVDLIVYALYNVELTDSEDNERRKIFKALQSSILDPSPYNPDEDPYAHYCDI